MVGDREDTRGETPPRRLKVVQDAFGRLWICPVGVDEAGDLAAQGGWRCGDRTLESLVRNRRDADD